MVKCFLRSSFLAFACLLALAVTAPAQGILRITADAKTLKFTVRSPHEFSLKELQPFEDVSRSVFYPALLETNGGAGEITFSLPRFNGRNDRIYAGFVLNREHESPPLPLGSVHYAENLESISKNPEPFPTAPSKKGLQVQMADDALALGIKHAALNFNLAALIRTKEGPDTIGWTTEGQKYWFNRRYLDGLKVKQLSDAGVQVSLILLYYLGGNPEADVFMKHPNCATNAPNRLTAFNTQTQEGLRHFKATMEFLADYYSGTNAAHGRVWGYIVGNEVNTHWEWYNMGKADRDTVVEDYLRTVRIAHTAVRKASASARVYLSLTHFWTQVYQGKPQQACGGKELLDEFNRRAKAGGDFDWHLAHHPYPENLFECRTWLDKKPTLNSETPQITFKNLEVLTGYFERPEMRYRGEPRRIILSEQGFHTSDKPEGELWQAAAYCYAYRKAATLPGIDAFIYHRHVDHRQEGGLRLGLWSRQPESISTPGKQKQIYGVFRAADSPDWEKAFEFALPVIGIKGWDEVVK